MDSTEKLEPLLTPAELADYLEVPVATLYAWRYHGDGPPGFRVGRHIRYRLRDVEQWLESRLDTNRRKGPSSMAAPIDTEAEP